MPHATVPLPGGSSVDATGKSSKRVAVSTNATATLRTMGKSLRCDYYRRLAAPTPEALADFTASQEKHRKLQARREELMRLMIAAGK